MLLKYPDDFNTPAFPAGKFVAVSRFMATVVMVIFFLVICLCGIIIWVKRTQSVTPFLISFNPNGERWTVVEYDNHSSEIPAYYVLQESLLDKFARDWFTIYDNIQLNQANWSKECARNSSECRETSVDSVDTCAIYCACSDSVYTNFEKVVLPVYSGLEVDSAAVWTVKNVSIKPLYSMKSITKYGGMWRLDISVQTNTGPLYFTGFAQVRYDREIYPRTMGYYVSDFNTYRMN